MSETRMITRTLQNRRRGRTDWTAVDAMTEEQIETQAAEDPDNPLWTEKEMSAGRLVLPGERAKIPVSIRLDTELIECFKEDGPGYQSRINAVLLGYVRSRRQRSR